ncbi:intracellular protease, PfpI family [Limihaloglobus sulfuriphilus]|uniref:Intracellular protease, PfpI family n=1 Tax=Limihaloglobus sulfuriphilus TaxID=1851148 RepID=A0A1Q2MBT6_9BACT|nr:DJ-1/PfpI family protein [Limihaloglobus sulfuriphilus]AQQ69702.1 intracellular protease, PfpI family [Limihaloglobus sulfuriphilus]
MRLKNLTFNNILRVIFAFTLVLSIQLIAQNGDSETPSLPGPPSEPTRTSQPADQQEQTQPAPSPNQVTLNQPETDSAATLTSAFRSVAAKGEKVYEPIVMTEISQLLWAGYGTISNDQMLRPVESVENGYPLELHVVTESNVFRYIPQTHSLEIVSSEDVRRKLMLATQKQRELLDSKVLITISASLDKVPNANATYKRKIAYIEAGRAAQNISLQAAAMNLASQSYQVMDLSRVRSLLNLNFQAEPVITIALSRLKGSTAPEEAETIESAGSKQAQQQTQEQPQQPAKIEPFKFVIIVPNDRVIEQDFFAVTEVLASSGVKVEVASSTMETIRGNWQGSIVPTMLLRDIVVNDFDAFVLIGNSLVRNQFDNEPMVVNIIREAYRARKLIGAVGRTPLILAYADIIENYRITGELSVRKQVENAGGIFTNSIVEVDEDFVTAVGTESANEYETAEGVLAVNRFTRSMITLLQGKEPQGYGLGESQPRSRRQREMDNSIAE